MGTGGDHVGPGLSTHFLESGWGVTDAKLALDKAPSARHLRNKKGGLARLMVEEASNWQCLMDAPWDHAWRSLTLAPFGDTEAHVVLTRVLTPTHYAMTVNAFHTRHHLAGFDWNATVKAYESRLANVRAAHYRNPRYVAPAAIEPTCIERTRRSHTTLLCAHHHHDELPPLSLSLRSASRAATTASRWPGLSASISKKSPRCQTSRRAST